MKALSSTLQQWIRIEGMDLVLRLTLLLLLLQPLGNWRVRGIVLALAAAGLLVSALQRRPALWLLLTFLTGWRLFLEWPVSDNHSYLLCYWCLAIFIALRREDGTALLSMSARVLIGLVFAFATLWKLALSPDYLDGTFFRVTLILDDRFEFWTLLLGGMTPDLLESHRAYLSQHVDGVLFQPLDRPAEPASFTRLARAATLWTIAIEGVVAIAFLWPWGKGPAQLRDALLLIFCATTFAFAPVAGFGWLLVILGIAQCAAENHRTRWLYLCVFALILLYRELAPG